MLICATFNLTHLSRVIYPFIDQLKLNLFYNLLIIYLFIIKLKIN